MRFSTSRRRDVWAVGLIVLIVTVQWCLTFRIFEGQRVLDPVSYQGDGHFTAASVAAGMRGEYLPFASKMLPSLGAPYVASWNDFPVAEDWLYFLVGTFARLVGVFGAINLGLWFACVLAGVSLFVVARRFHLNRPFAMMSGALYGFTMYIVSRGTHHFSLTFYWVVPWQILVSAWLASRKGLAFKSVKFRIALAVAVITGWSFIYYSFFAMQLFALALLVRLGRPKRLQSVLVALCLAAAAGLAVFSVSADSIFFIRQNGLNQAAIYRNPQDVEFYALKPIALFVPGGNHKWPFFRNLSNRASEQAMIQAEIPAPYLGILQELMLLGLGVSAAFAIAKRRLNITVTWAMTVAWLIIGHSVGGENSLLGLAGLRLFRSVNRVSIVIMAYVVLFGAWGLTRLLKRFGPKVKWSVALAVALFGTFEPIPVVVSPEWIAQGHRIAESDRALVAAAEAALPEGAAIYELPAMHFPEVPPQGGVDTYEMFRPYFFARHLRFSHGDVKGRPNAEWKFQVSGWPAPQLLAELRARGFSGIYVNLKGVPPSRVEELQAAGARFIAKAAIGDSLFLAL